VSNKNNFAYTLLILTTIFWSGNFIVGKAASMYDIPPFSLNFYRWLFAWLILLPFTYKEILKKKRLYFKQSRVIYNFRSNKYNYLQFNSLLFIKFYTGN